MTIKKTEHVILQPSEIRLRHIIRVDKSGAPEMGMMGVGPETMVLTKEFVGYWGGLNGAFGFVSGDYLRREGEEGSFSVVFPNAAGEDGVLHRKRFAILTDPAYRPGDEWIEIWKGSPPGGELKFVGTPTAYKLSMNTVEISGFDGLFLLRGTHEFEGTGWRHAPRDVFEHYTTAWVSTFSEDFTSSSLTYNTSETDSADVRYKGLRAGTTGLPDAVGNPEAGSVRIYPGAASTPAYVRGHPTHMAFEIGLDSAEPHEGWRFETEFSRTSLGTGTTARVGMINGSLSLILYFEVSETEAKVVVGSESRTIKLDTNPPGPLHVTVEGRHEWVYFYTDGVFRGVMAMPVGPETVSPFVQLSQGASDTSDETYLDVHSMLLRRSMMFLSEDGMGDLDTPLSATSPKEGLQGEYYIDTDLRPAALSAFQYKMRFAPGKSPYSRRIDRAVNFGHQLQPPTWQPAGPPSGNFFSVRWLGSAEMDLETYNYRFRAYSGGRMRMWLAKTRHGEELLDKWDSTVENYANTVLTPSDYLTDLGSPGTNRGLPKQYGWWPIVIEWSKDLGTGAPNGIHVEYERTDQPDNWVVLGLNSYDHLIYSQSPVGFWKVNEGWGGFTGAPPWELYDHSNNNRDGTYTPTTSAHAVRAGPRPGSLAHVFNGTTQFASVPFESALNPAQFTIEAWVYPNGGAGNIRRAVASADYVTPRGYDIGLTAANTWDVRIGTGAAFTSVAGGSVTLNRWYHLVATYDGADARVYVNGALVAGPTAVALTANPTRPFTIGANSGVTTSQWWFGAVCNVVLHSSVLDATAIAANYAAMREDPGEGRIRLSPIGCYPEEFRAESHYESLKTIAETYALQFTCEPQSLESTMFPGMVTPKNRLGRDTDMVIDAMEATDFTVDGSVEDTADTLFADGRGIAHGSGVGNTKAEMVNFPEMEGSFIPKSEYESIADIQNKDVFLRRLESLLLLRTNVWEQVTARPQGADALLDTFPLTDELALFNWEPGDGVRIWIPEIGIEDTVPRQIKGVGWPFTPFGVGRPSVTFRQRPRRFHDLIRKIYRSSVSLHRHYQGELVTVSGSIGGRNNAAWPDNYTRVNMPEDVGSIIRAEFVLQNVVGGTWDLQINGTTRYSGINEPGRYDVTEYAAKEPTDANLMYARLNETTATGSACHYMLELLVRI